MYFDKELCEACINFLNMTALRSFTSVQLEGFGKCHAPHYKW